ncbi:MFS transporter [Nakamurella silvestris]|nr:MFS transporter [Nakamurella silvestris]
MSTSTRPLAPGPALIGSAAAFAGMYLAAGALTPLLVEYQRRWDFPPDMLGVAFAVYALGFLLAAVTLGSLSDRIGRRPVLLGSLVVQLASNILFLAATGIGEVVIGRLAQGVACGAATSAFTAVMVELAPVGRKKLGAVLGSVCLTGGLALGSILAGWAVQVTPAANSIVFGTLITVTFIGGVAIALSPETVQRSVISIRSLIPRVSVPAGARREFVAAAPAVAAVWMLAGLSGGLTPAMIRSVFHLDSGFLNGLTGFVAPAVSTVIGISFARVRPGRALTIGIHAATIGAVGIAAGVLAGNLPLMVVGQAVAGLGFGACFPAALQLLVPLAAAGQRAGLVAAIYVVCYVAFGVPIIVEGLLVRPFGQVGALILYTAVTVVLALSSLLARARLNRRAVVPPVFIPTESC